MVLCRYGRSRLLTRVLVLVTSARHEGFKIAELPKTLIGAAINSFVFHGREGVEVCLFT